MHRGLFFVLIVLLLTPSLFAVSPAKELFLPSVGRGQGACPGGVCSQWRTDVWIFNDHASAAVTVEISFFARGADNNDPARQNVVVEAGETRELADVMQSVFNMDGVFGGLRFSAEQPIVVTGRIFDSNVQTNAGSGTAGQFFGALPARASIGVGESTELIGLARDGDWRTNFGFVETSGESATVEATLFGGDGSPLANETYEIGAFGVDQESMNTFGGSVGQNRRIRLEVVGGQGRILAFASRIDSRTGDPSTVEMVGGSALTHSEGVFSGLVESIDGLRVDGGIELLVSEDGVVGLSGLTGIPCGDDLFSVDFFLSTTYPFPIAEDGSFSATLTQAYVDNAIQLFAIDWTLDGSLDDNGAMNGTLTSQVYDGVGFWAPCDGASQRLWRAGWTAGGSR